MIHCPGFRVPPTFGCPVSWFCRWIAGQRLARAFFHRHRQHGRPRLRRPRSPACPERPGSSPSPGLPAPMLAPKKNTHHSGARNGAWGTQIQRPGAFPLDCRGARPRSSWDIAGNSKSDSNSNSDSHGHLSRSPLQNRTPTPPLGTGSGARSSFATPDVQSGRQPRCVAQDLVPGGMQDSASTLCPPSAYCLPRTAENRSATETCNATWLTESKILSNKQGQALGILY